MFILCVFAGQPFELVKPIISQRPSLEVPEDLTRRLLAQLAKSAEDMPTSPASPRRAASRRAVVGLVGLVGRVFWGEDFLGPPARCPFSPTFLVGRVPLLK